MKINYLEWKHSEGYKHNLNIGLQFIEFEQALEFVDLVIRFMKEKQNETKDQSSSSAPTTR